MQSQTANSTTSSVVLNDQIIESLKPALVFKNFQKEVNSIDISHDGKYLVAGCEDNSVSLYDLERGEKINTYYSKRYGVDLVRFTHHNKTILCASKRDNNYRIMYWSLHDNNILCSFVGHTDQITHLDLNPLNSTFVSCSKDGTTRVWEYEKKQCLFRLNKSKAACFDNTGNVLACVYLKEDASSKGQDGQGGASGPLVQQIHLFNAASYETKPFSIFMMEEIPEIKFLKFSYNGQFILLGSVENTITLIDAFEGKQLHKFTSNLNDPGIFPMEAGFTPDTRYVVSGSEASKRVTFWNIETGKEIQLMEFHPKSVACVKFSHVYCMMVSACQNLVVWIPDRVGGQAQQ